MFTIPSHKLGGVLKQHVPGAASKLDEFYYPPVGAVTVAYPESAIREDRMAVGGGKLVGFGQLHPRPQKITTLGTIYSSVLFPGRAPPGMVLLLNYIGGAQNTAIEKMTEDQLVEQVDKDLRVMLLKPDAPKARKVGVRVWNKAIPQFNIGHLDVLEGARKSLQQAKWDGVFLGGNYSAGARLRRPCFCPPLPRSLWVGRAAVEEPPLALTPRGRLLAQVWRWGGAWRGRTRARRRWRRTSRRPPRRSERRGCRGEGEGRRGAEAARAD